MAKIRYFKYEWGKVQYLYNCPACGYEHAFALKTEGGHHTWDNNYDNPTVHPSLDNQFTPGKRCHHFIKNGIIEFCSDCDHELRGQKMPLPEYDPSKLTIQP